MFRLLVERRSRADEEVQLKKSRMSNRVSEIENGVSEGSGRERGWMATLALQTDLPW